MHYNGKEVAITVNMSGHEKTFMSAQDLAKNGMQFTENRIQQVYGPDGVVIYQAARKGKEPELEPMVFNMNGTRKEVRSPADLIRHRIQLSSDAIEKRWGPNGVHLVRAAFAAEVRPDLTAVGAMNI